MPGLSILGYNIEFPNGKKPFPAQLAVISKCLVALSRKENALLESPTGTGKVTNCITLGILVYILSRPLLYILPTVYLYICIYV